ncbi:c-type cytochrome [Rhodobacterales bacterium HKCCE2091]|nr:c-type cytochrome [Rhodobacterales bacterium HKCCE2091]
MTRVYAISLGAIALAVAASLLLVLRTGEGAAQEPDPGRIAEGRALYEANCAACHGANLQGQPFWQRRDPNTARLPAPPHDASGHTWHHPDAVLFRIVREGTEAVVGNGYESDMPGFGDVLTDDEIRAVLDYIRSTWPERERAYQAQVTAANP